MWYRVKGLCEIHNDHVGLPVIVIQYAKTPFHYFKCPFSLYDVLFRIQKSFSYFRVVPFRENDEKESFAHYRVTVFLAVPTSLTLPCVMPTAQSIFVEMVEAVPIGVEKL